MKYRHYLKYGRRLFHSFRRFSNDPSKTFRDKGLAEENRYFMRKQEEELKRLREEMKRLESQQQNLEEQLEKANKALLKLCDGKDCKKEK